MEEITVTKERSCYRCGRTIKRGEKGWTVRRGSNMHDSRHVWKKNVDLAERKMRNTYCSECKEVMYFDSGDDDDGELEQNVEIEMAKICVSGLIEVGETERGECW